MKSLQNLKFNPGDRIFVRYGLDVPLSNGVVMEEYRLLSGLKTLQFIIENGGIPVIAGHMGKPEGKVVPQLSTKILKPFFDKHLGIGTFELLENLRFDPGEEANDVDFAIKISHGCVAYVNESFETSHRNHASFVGIPKILPAYAGFRVILEVENLSKLFSNPARPFTVIIGGAKLESKKPVVDTFLKKADNVLLAGKIGMDWSEDIPTNLHLPEDYFDGGTDIGQKSLSSFLTIISNSKTILWAGPAGKYEQPESAVGSIAIAKACATAKKSGAFVVAGGGDTVSVIDMAGVMNDFSFVSVGGSAMLEFLAKGDLPGLAVL